MILRGSMIMKELFIFWQFNGDNRSFCNQTCPYCYGLKMKDYKHYWNSDIAKWEQAFERLQRDIYFEFSYGEPMGGHGFYECLEMVGEHSNWTLNVITNLSLNPSRMLSTRLAKEGRLFINACWHPLGVNNRDESWFNFKKNLLMLHEANIHVHVMMVWYRPQINLFPEYFKWFDSHDFRVHVRRFVKTSFYQKIPYVRRLRWFAGKTTLDNYTNNELGFLYAQASPKLQKYELNLESSYGKLCNAGKDMILVKYDGNVGLCASCFGPSHILGNIFDSSFKLNDKPVKCPSNTCGGCFGMLVLHDKEYEPLPSEMWHDTFVSQVEGLREGHPIQYQHRKEMLEWLNKIECQRT